MPVTSNDIANQAIALIGDNQPAVTGQAPTFDNSTAGIALQRLYAPCVATVARQYGFDFSRRIATLVASGNPAPHPYGFTQEFIYPGNGIEIWEMIPGVQLDENNPLPTTWVVGNTQVSGTQTKVIWTSVLAPQVTFNNNPSEATWDATFRESVVRLLASELASAIAGKPETEASMLQSAAAFTKIAETRNG